MKKNKQSAAALEREVLELSKNVPLLTEGQGKWMEDEAKNYIFHTTKKAWCSVCGEEFAYTEDMNKAVVDHNLIECPHCHAKCEAAKSRRIKTDGSYYVQIVETCKGWQVIRYFYCDWSSRKGRPRLWYEREVFQRWCKPGVKTIAVGGRLTAFPYQAKCPFSIWSNEWKVRHSDWYDEWMYLTTYPRVKLLPEYKKFGIRPRDTHYPMSTVISVVFSHPYLESLYKAKRYKALDIAIKCEYDVRRWWPSIKVALRHGFDTDDIKEYVDYLEELERLGRDTKNPKYLVPADYGKAREETRLAIHAKYERERREALKEQEERNRQRLIQELEKNEEYEKRIAKFATLCIADNEIEIKPLMSIQEFLDEGNAMHHCVFSNGYYDEEDSLIMSAKHNGERVETIEVDLKSLSVVQCRGKFNQFTPMHEHILQMCADGMAQIKRLSKMKVSI